LRKTLLAAALALLALPASASAADYAPGQVIVKLRPGVAAASTLRDHHARVQRSLPVAGIVVADVPAGVRAAVRDLERDPRVLWAEPNARREAGSLPNDAFFAEQWGLRNTGQTVNGAAGAAGADIDVAGAWARTTGSPSVKVAVVDSGINFHQPDLAPNVWRNPGESGGGRETNGVDDDHDGFVDDYRGWDFVQQDNDPSDNYGHGSHVAGTIAARGGNGIGVAGVAWRASVIPVRVLDNTDGGYCAEIAAGMAYAVRAGARVVNMSSGSPMRCQAEKDVIDGAPSVLFVAAAMNDSANVDMAPYYPCAYDSPNVVCVAATDSRDRLAPFSNYGARSVDLAAPGVSVLSSYVKWGPKQLLFADDFEKPLDGRWVTGGGPDTWQRTPFAPLHGGGFSVAPSTLGSFSASTDSWIRLANGIDLTGHADCAVAAWLDQAITGYNPSAPIDAQDRLLVETSRDGVHWDRRPTILVGSTTGFQRWVFDLSQIEGRAGGGVRLRIASNADGVTGHVAVDDLEVFCVPPVTAYTGAADEFIYDWGTSMAAPHVSGTAVLMLSLDPKLSAAELKRRLLASVDRVPGLAGRTVSGGRLNAARAVTPATGRPSAPPLPTQGYALTIDLKALARDLGGRRAVLRRGGFRADRLHAFTLGRFKLVVKRRGRTIAKGSHACAGPAVCSLKARLTRSGRAALRRSRRPRLALALTFAPRSGRALVRRATVRLGR
jgi:subtilisin family serine protease